MEIRSEANLHEENQCIEQKEDSKFIKKVFGVISYLVFILLLLFIIAILLAVFKGKGQDNLPVILNHQVYIIRI